MIVDSGISQPIDYVDATYTGGLFVRANIYDLSGGSPVLESTVNLAILNNSVYQGKYTFTAGKPYLVQKLVYTDGTYTTVDQTFAQGADDIQCIAVQSKLANLDATVSSRLASASYTAPDNADITAIKAKTDNLPADPASNTEVDTRAPAVTALSTAVWTNSKAADLDAAISTRATPADITAAEAAIAALIAAVPGDVWDAVLAAHLLTGSFGEAITTILNKPSGGGGGGSSSATPCTLDVVVENQTLEIATQLEQDLGVFIGVEQDLSNC